MSRKQTLTETTTETPKSSVLYSSYDFLHVCGVALSSLGVVAGAWLWLATSGRSESARYIVLLSALFLASRLVVFRRAAFTKPDDAMREYKRVLAGILPREWLTPEGFLRGHDGKPEPIRIVALRGEAAANESRPSVNTIAGAGFDLTCWYSGGLFFKAMRHRLEKCRESLSVEEYAAIREFVDGALQLAGDGNDVINIENLPDDAPGALAHEAFHDIQGFLYDNHPDAIEALQNAVLNRREWVTSWYKGYEKRLVGYAITELFPATVNDVRGFWARRNKSLSDFLTLQIFSSEAAKQNVAEESCKDEGRLEIVPTLLQAAVEGYIEAKAILRDVFTEAGLKTDLCERLGESRLNKSEASESA